MISYCLTSGDGSGWAIDEDARLVRQALAGIATETSITRAAVVHSPFWMGLASHAPSVLARRFVIANADNPPFFYLTQPAFAWAQRMVDLWVARSTEALEQFRLLGLKAVHIPYAIDERLFFPISDRSSIRTSLGIPEGRYVIANFHRDSEGSDLSKPKLQKAPELLVLICRKLLAAGAPIHVLLAGPRRHWIRQALREANIPFTFVGKEVSGDDFGLNILPREELNRLTNACDLYLIPSRWEGGPQSAMEAAACRTKILSIPLGVARDILEPQSLFETTPEAVQRVLEDIRADTLSDTLDPQLGKFKASHTSQRMSEAFRNLFTDNATEFHSKLRLRPVADRFAETAWQLRRRMPKRKSPVAITHRLGLNEEHDGVMASLAAELQRAGVPIRARATITIAGCVSDPKSLAGRVSYQFAPPNLSPCEAIRGACVVFHSVHDAVNFKEGGGRNPVIVCAFPMPPQPINDEPLIIDAADPQASIPVSRAMLAGRPVVYPDTSHYWYQVFHGGISYGKRSLDSAVKSAGSDVSDFRQLARPPESATARVFLRSLAEQPFDSR